MYSLKNSKILGKFFHNLFILLIVSEVDDEIGEDSVEFWIGDGVLERIWRMLLVNFRM